MDAHQGNLFVDVNLPDVSPQPMEQSPEGKNLPLPVEDDKDQIKFDFYTSVETMLEAMGDSTKQTADLAQKSAPALETIAGNVKNDVNQSSTEKQKKKKINEYFMKKMVAADFFTSVGKSLSNIAKKIGGGLLDLLGALMIFALLGPEFLNGIIDLVISTLVMLINAFIQAIPTVVNAIITWLPVIIDAITNAIMTLIPILADTLPKLVTLLAGAVVKLVGSLAKILPILIPALMKVFVTIITALIDLLPVVLEALIGMFVLIVEEISKLFGDDKFINTMIGAFMKIIEALVKAAPVIITALVALIPKIYDAMIKVLSSLGDNANLPGWLRGIFKFLAAMTEFYKSIVMGLINGIKWVIDNWDTVWKGFKKVVSFIVAIFNPLTYVKLFTRLLKAIIHFMIGRFIPQILSTFDNLMKKFSLGNVLDEAKNMGKKIIDKIFGEGSFDKVTLMLKDARETIDKIVNKFLDSDIVKNILSFIKGKEEPKSRGQQISEMLGTAGFKKAEDIRNDLAGTKEDLLRQVAIIQDSRGDYSGNVAAQEYAKLLKRLADLTQTGQQVSAANAEKLLQQMIEASGSDKTLQLDELKTLNLAPAR